MNRRSFFSACGGLVASRLDSSADRKTKHVILIVPGGARKKDYYENPLLAKNVRRIARDGFVFEEDHCEHIASHDMAFTELIQDNRFVSVKAIEDIPAVMERGHPRLVVFRDRAYEAGHESFEKYLSAVRANDAAIGALFDWIRSDWHFNGRTSLIIRPEFGRDDEVNQHGHLHHSYGFYSTHRVARILWGPDFTPGVDKKTIVTSHDLARTIGSLLKPA